MSRSPEQKFCALPRFRPNTDILEREDGFYIYMDMPGVDKQNLHIDMHEDRLEIRGRSLSPREDTARTLHVEFGDGEYIRAFTLAEGVHREGIRATLTNGLLEIFLPKTARFRPRRIPIQES